MIMLFQFFFGQLIYLLVINERTWSLFDGYLPMLMFMNIITQRFVYIKKLLYLIDDFELKKNIYYIDLLHSMHGRYPVIDNNQ